MNYAWRPGEDGLHGYEYANSNAMPLGTLTYTDEGHPVPNKTVQAETSYYPSPYTWENTTNHSHNRNVTTDEGYTVPNTTVREEISYHPSPYTLGNTTDHSHNRNITAKHRGCFYTFISWWPELLWCFLGVVAIMAEVLILAHADGQPPSGITSFLITVNSLIQFITSVLKVAFVVPNVSALGQLRWLWYKDVARPLTDFLLHDDAGSGGLNSLKFFLTFTKLFKWPVAWLASTVAISGFFTSPVTQQAISYVSDRQVLNNGTASVLRASTFSRSDPSGFIPMNGDDLKIQTAYITAAYLASDQKLPGVDPICSSGDCDWPTYGSLGICAETVDISASKNSSLLFLLQEIFLGELRNSQYSTVFAQAGSGPYYLAALIPFISPSSEFKEAPPQMVISQYFVGYFNSPVTLTNNADLAKIQYIGVSLYICTQSFSTTVKGGIHNTSELAYSNNIISSTTTESINSVWNNALFDNQTCDPGPQAGSTITLSGATGVSNETYTVDFCTGVYLSQLFIIGVSGGILLSMQRSVVDTVGQISQALGNALYGEYNSSSIPDPQTKYGNIELMMNNIAKSLTNFMRNEGPTYPNQNNSTVTGIAYAPQTLIHIRWSYLSLPVIQVALTIFVLLSTIVMTYRSGMQILKGSPLAVMCALSEAVKEKLGGIDDMKSLKSNAKKVSVRLGRGTYGDASGFELA